MFAELQNTVNHTPQTESHWLRILESTEVMAALLGALAGGVATYLVTSYLEGRKQRQQELSLTSVVMFEILTHLNSVALALEHVLPQWLKIDRGGYDLKEAQLASNIYHEYFATLVAAKFGTSLIWHYEQVNVYNNYVTKNAGPLPLDDVKGYVRTIENLLIRGTNLVTRMRGMRGMRRFTANPEHDSLLSTFDNQINKRNLMLRAINVDRYALKDYLMAGERSQRKRELPKEVLDADFQELKSMFSQ